MYKVLTFPYFIIISLLAIRIGGSFTIQRKRGKEMQKLRNMFPDMPSWGPKALIAAGAVILVLGTFIVSNKYRDNDSAKDNDPAKASLGQQATAPAEQSSTPAAPAKVTPKKAPVVEPEVTPREPVVAPAPPEKPKLVITLKDDFPVVASYHVTGEGATDEKLRGPLTALAGAFGKKVSHVESQESNGGYLVIYGRKEGPPNAVTSVTVTGGTAKVTCKLATNAKEKEALNKIVQEIAEALGLGTLNVEIGT
ncbi:MAG: hypothetical protein ABIA92_04795 [Patescibacteria group bacterium]